MSLLSKLCTILKWLHRLPIIAIPVISTYVGMTFGYQVGAAALFLCAVFSLLFGHDDIEDIDDEPDEE